MSKTETVVRGLVALGVIGAALTLVITGHIQDGWQLILAAVLTFGAAGAVMKDGD